MIFIFFFRRANVDSGWTEVHSRYVSFLEMRSNEGSFVMKKDTSEVILKQNVPFSYFPPIKACNWPIESLKGTIDIAP